MCYILYWWGLLHLLPMVCGMEWTEYKGLWYYISDGEMVEYEQATEMCKSMKGHLAVITNDDQNDFLRRKEFELDERWIGMSTQRSHHYPPQCGDKLLVWDKDWNCTNTFTPRRNLVNRPFLDCAAVTSKISIWTVRDCSRLFGYICQWECKRFYMDITRDTGVLNGIYEFDTYYNGHALYSKQGTERKIQIFYLKKDGWILQNRDNGTPWRARTKNELYVPYGHKPQWETLRKQELASNTFCIDSNILYMWILPSLDNKYVCKALFLNDSIPEYANSEETVFLKRYRNSESCVCMTTRDLCGQNCGYIFPYPNVSTTVTLSNNNIIKFTNNCIASEKPITTTLAARNTSSTDNRLSTPLLDVDKSSNVIVVVSSIVPLIALISIVFVIIVVTVKGRNKNRNDQPDQYISDKTKHPGLSNRNTAIDNNVYMEIDDNIEANTLEPMYADPDAGQACEHITQATDSKDKPIVGYLASDYGVLMDDLTTNPDLNLPKPTHEQPVYIDVIEIVSKQGNELNKSSENALHIIVNHESEKKNISNKGQSGQGAHNVELHGCDYYNVGAAGQYDEGDDDLELFENTVYNQT